MRQVGGSLGIAVMARSSRPARSLHLGNPPEIAYLHGFDDALKVAALPDLAGAIVPVGRDPQDARAPKSLAPNRKDEVSHDAWRRDRPVRAREEGGSRAYQDRAGRARALPADSLAAAGERV
jgi:hypothetical protein